MQSDCEFTHVEGKRYKCVICGMELVTKYDIARVHRNCPIELVQQVNAPGVGTELHKILKHMGVDTTLDCKCTKRIAVMNTKGSKWCRINVGLIVQWLREAARERKLASYRMLPRVVWNMGAARLVWVAIRRAERVSNV